MEKIIRNTLNGQANFHLHSFIIDMDLNGSQRLVYAFLYSFSKGKPGVYYGTQKYLAKTLQMSERTISRVYKKLYEKGLIEKCVSKDGTIKGIRTVLPKNANPKAKPDEQCEEANAGTKYTPPKKVCEIEKSLPYVDSKYAFIEIPGCDVVSITENQYKKLRQLVGSDVLYGYAKRLNNYLYEHAGTRIPRIRSHYKLIKSWIEEDLGT